MKFEELAAILMSREDQCLGTGADEAEIRLAEEALGIRIHGSYRDFISRFGWGGVGHVELYGLGKDVPPHLNLVRITKSERTEMRPMLPKYLLPIMNDGAGNLYCADTMFMRGNEPRVVFWDHDGMEDQEMEVVADDFSEWLKMMIDEST